MVRRISYVCSLQNKEYVLHAITDDIQFMWIQHLIPFFFYVNMYINYHFSVILNVTELPTIYGNRPITKCILSDQNPGCCDVTNRL